MAKNLFEATLIGCQSLNKPSAKKSTKAKNLAESRKVSKRRRITEDEEVDELPDDMIDDAIVVVDPELEVEEIADNLDNLQAILDATADGEVATSDEYVGDDIYACPICGNNFFSETEMEDGAECPVCGETPDGYVLVGEVSDPEDAAAEEEPIEDEEPAEDADVEDEISDEEIEDDITEEDLDLVDAEDEEDVVESKKARTATLNFEEKRLNRMLTAYVTENYKNAKSMTVKNVILRGASLVCECIILFNSGKKSKTNIQFEGFDLSKKQFRLRGTEVGKSICAESRFPFMLEAKMIRNNIVPTAFRYNYKVTKEGKSYRVSGKTLAE